MKNTWHVFLILGVVMSFVGTCEAGLFKLDFSILQGEAPGWDVFERLVEDELYMLTDTAGTGDDDVTMTVLNGSASALMEFTGNNPAPPTDTVLHDDVEIPVEASGDYLYRNPDAAGTSALFRFDNLSPGDYRVSVFEGRTTDSSQFAVIWVGDENGSGEPAGQNTDNFAGMANIRSLDLTIGEGQRLWYRHLEDNSGGISGMTIRQLRGLELLPGDFNEDGALDTADFLIMASNFNKDGAFADGDINFSGHIDLVDFAEFRTLFHAQGQAAAVPEPGSMVLVLLLTVGIIPVTRGRTRLAGM